MFKDKSVVLCDDDEFIISDLLDLTQNLKMKPRAFNNAKEALESIVADPPDLMISDINMPNMTGLELLNRLNQRQLQIPVIFLTGSLDPKNFYQAISYGYFDYLHKPVVPDELVLTIKKALAFGYQPAPTGVIMELLQKKIG